MKAKSWTARATIGVLMIFVSGCEHLTVMPRTPAGQGQTQVGISLSEALKEIASGFDSLDAATTMRSMGVFPCKMVVFLQLTNSSSRKRGNTISVLDYYSTDLGSETVTEHSNNIQIEMQNPVCLGQDSIANLDLDEIKAIWQLMSEVSDEEQ